MFILLEKPRDTIPDMLSRTQGADLSGMSSNRCSRYSHAAAFKSTLHARLVHGQQTSSGQLAEKALIARQHPLALRALEVVKQD